jgi:UDP-N-acetylglucosamine--N-acetylmuramyl-(pentapeptide) pyrophosphoryl-undecaprenol N-acetylglucosamine transferase
MVCITGGGTGGHLRIVSVLREELNRLGIKPIFIGSSYGKDREWIEGEMGWEATYFLKSGPVVNKQGLKKAGAVGGIVAESLKAYRLLKKHKIEKVISVGGYSAAPASFGAVIGHRELYLHEQNAILGKLNRILKPFSDRIFNSFFFDDPYPVDEQFFHYQRERKQLKSLIFLGGSQGATGINQLALQLAPELRKRGIQIIHQTGESHFEEVAEGYRKLGLKVGEEVDLFPFERKLVQKLHRADFAISRAGASTLWELVSNGLPTLFIPYPYAAENHQYHNALYLVNQRLGWVLTQPEATPERVLKILEGVEQYLLPVSKSLMKLNSPNGAHQIVEEVLKGPEKPKSFRLERKRHHQQLKKLEEQLKK